MRAFRKHDVHVLDGYGHGGPRDGPRCATYDGAFRVPADHSAKDGSGCRTARYPGYVSLFDSALLVNRLESFY
jgi:hypothetical protein